jgi:hypothetical protein
VRNQPQGQFHVYYVPVENGRGGDVVRITEPHGFGHSRLYFGAFDDQRELRRVTDLPVMHRLWVHRTGYSLGYTKRGRLDPAQMYFVSNLGAVLSVVEMDNRITEVVEGENDWYVGFNNGSLHAFALSGRRLWRWHAPEFTDCYHTIPLYVSNSGKLIVAGSGGVLYALSFAGTVVWRAELADRAQARYRIEVPDAEPGSSRDHALDKLGMPGCGTAESVEIFRFRQTFSTEPSSWFGSERPLSLITQEEEEVAHEEIVLEMHLGGGMCSEDLVHIGASNDVILAGTSRGRVCFFDRNGDFLGDCAVGNGLAVRGENQKSIKNIFS